MSRFFERYWNNTVFPVSARYTRKPASNPGAANFAVGKDPEWLAVADFNGDGKPDIAVVNSMIDSATILLNTSM